MDIYIQGHVICVTVTGGLEGQVDRQMVLAQY
jgi:hypothetical protein